MTTGSIRSINTSDVELGDRYAKRVALAKIAGMPRSLSDLLHPYKKEARFDDPHTVGLLDRVFKEQYPFHTQCSMGMLRKIYSMVLDTKDKIEQLEGDWYRSVRFVISNLLLRYSHFSKQQQKIMELKKQLYSSKGLLLAGTKSHAILLVNQKEALTVYNSGSGGNRTEDPDYSRTVQYRNLTKEQLVPPFFRKLKWFSNNETDMGVVNAYLSEVLLNKDQSNLFYPSVHKTQANGTCTYKSISYYMRDMLKDEEHRKFKLFLTIELRKELLKIMRYKEKLGNIDLEKMLQGVNEILAKRKGKVCQYYADAAKEDTFWKWVEANDVASCNE